MHADGQCLFYGLDDNLWIEQVFYGRDFSADETIVYRPVVDKLELYLLFLQMGWYFQTR